MGGRPGTSALQLRAGSARVSPSDAPLPQVGDTILLPRKVTGDTKEQAFAWGGTLAPFRVIEVEHVYFRDSTEKFTLANPKPAQYVRTMIAVRRLTPEQFDADPGQAVG